MRPIEAWFKEKKNKKIKKREEILPKPPNPCRHNHLPTPLQPLAHIAAALAYTTGPSPSHHRTYGHRSTQRGTRERGAGIEWENQNWRKKMEMRVTGERERKRSWKTNSVKAKSEKWIKYQYFGLQLCYSAILHLGWHCSTIAKKLKFLDFTIVINTVSVCPVKWNISVPADFDIPF